VIEVRQLVKRFGSRTALDSVSFTAHPGKVTAILGPNGSGKTTAIRILLGLDAADSGSALVSGTRYRDLRSPLFEVGALLDHRSAHPARSAFDHLLALAATHRIPRPRVHDVIDLTGLDPVANARAGTFSLGMSQRLGIAAALLGDPRILVLDEPMNGLDPEGVAWIRSMCRAFADEGRTVFLSSHLLAEVESIADRVVILGRGRVLADGTLAELGAAQTFVRVRTRHARDLAIALERSGATVEFDGEDLAVRGASAAQVGESAARSGFALELLSPESPTLESIFATLTTNEIQYRSRGGSTAYGPRDRE